MSLDALLYLLCLGGGFLFLVILALMGHFFDGAGHHDVGSGGHAAAGADGSGVSVFSPIMIAAFMTAFGAFGYLREPSAWPSSRFIGGLPMKPATKVVAGR